MSLILSGLNLRSGRLSCLVQTDVEGLPEQLYFEAGIESEQIINNNYDCMAVAILPLAMMLGEDIEVKGSLDGRLYENMLEAISLYATWYPNLVSSIEIKADELRSFVSVGDKQKVMSFYSGGVDSLFNIAGRLSENLLPVDVCVLVRGMDISIEDEELWEKVSHSLKLNLDGWENMGMISVETNARLFQPQGVDWTSTGFGPILGAISNFLSKGFSDSIIGSYGLYKDLEPHASGPLIDRLWSSGSIDIKHYSPRYSRLDKIRIINEETPELLRYVRVCWKNPDGEYNCGICEKCLRTKVELYIEKADCNVDSFGVYDLSEDLKYLKGNIPIDSYTHKFWEEMAELIEDPKILIRIEEALSTYRKFQSIKLLIMNFKRVVKKYIRRS